MYLLNQLADGFFSFFLFETPLIKLEAENTLTKQRPGKVS